MARRARGRRASAGDVAPPRIRRVDGPRVRLTLRADWGACYWAEDPLGAFVEVFRTRLLLTDDDIDARELTTITIGEPLELADLTKRAALAAGVTADLVHGADYTGVQMLASDVVELRQGVRWRVRHDLEQELIGVALFGRLGTDASFARDEHAEPISPELQEQAGRAFGYEVLPGIRP
ncbi:MAG: RES domain-containing protein [Solirubrobacterales bacterium]|nr:RES domain-containing protein [Solirubrobacterales bacterium]